jgi:hypothetical protein
MKRIATALVIAAAFAMTTHADPIRLPKNADHAASPIAKPAGSATDAMKADPAPTPEAKRKWLDDRLLQINELQKKANELKDRDFFDNFAKFIGVDGGNGDIIARTSPDIDVNAATAGPFGTTWVTETSTGQRYVMTLVQTGANVVGAYEPLEGGTPGLLAGTVEGRTLTYRWREGAASDGFGKFVLSADGISFKGWWNNSTGDANRVDGRWTGERKDAAGRVALPIQTKNDATTSAAKAGEFKDEREEQLGFDMQTHLSDANDAAARGAPLPDWRTFGAEWATATSANVAYAMKLTQTGTTVRGTYARDGRTVGSLEGTLEGDTLVYRWREGMSTGSGKFKLSADGKSFTGWWNNDDASPDAVAGHWNGTRK